ncbi:hypothetical protein TW86_17060 [Halomonas sp. S2151]|nr:hypothetical protein TW86_17060 [Halomonas sp. S2151]
MPQAPSRADRCVRRRCQVATRAHADVLGRRSIRRSAQRSTALVRTPAVRTPPSSAGARRPYAGARWTAAARADAPHAVRPIASPCVARAPPTGVLRVSRSRRLLQAQQNAALQG